MWAMWRDGAHLECVLVDFGAHGVRVLVRRDGEWVLTRTCPAEAFAYAEVYALHEEYLREGWCDRPAEHGRRV